MDELEKIINQLNECLELAAKAESFFITITRKEEKKLTHTQFQYKFPDDDLIHSLDELKRLVNRDAKEKGKHLPNPPKMKVRTFH